MPLISVIVPVYNVEKYIDLCMESLLKQTFGDLEVILVDDGSSDRSGKICDEYAEKDDRVVSVHKPNGGVSSARNAGLERAQGKYICFADPDDYLNNDMLENMYEIAEKNNCDLVSSCYLFMYENESKPDRIAIDCVQRVVERAEFLSAVLPKLYSGFDCPVWNKMYRARIIRENKIRFKENISIGEDYLFTLEYSKYIHNYYYTDKIGYCYRIRGDSAMAGAPEKHFTHYSRLYKEKKKLIALLEADKAVLSLENANWIRSIDRAFLNDVKNIPFGKKCAVHLRRKYFGLKRRIITAFLLK